MLKSFRVYWARCSLATRWALGAVLLTGVNAWLGALLAVASVWMGSRTPTGGINRGQLFSDHLKLWFALPVAMALVTLAYGKALPPDDLMRHIGAWQLGLDYRAQYPWADIPKANLWLGFDYLLGQLQVAGLTPKFILQWLPGVGIILNAIVLYGGLARALTTPRLKLHPEFFLLLAALGLMLTTPRMLLGRPEAFLAALGGAAWLCRTRAQAVVWSLGYVLAIPGYWLGWAYAPFALLLPLKSWRNRFLAAAGLGVLHLTFWQWYTGDYLGLLHWLSGTLSVMASENEPMLATLADWACWAFFLLLSWVLAIRLQQAGRATTVRQASRRLRSSLPAVLLLAWLAAPNQVRYQAALAFALLPWMLRSVYSVWRARQRGVAPVGIPALLVMAALALAGLQQVSKREPAPTFALGANARVYSEQPYATVFYGLPGIAVEPSFALGATLPQWKRLASDGIFDCHLAQLGGFTHLIEKSLLHIPNCVTLHTVQGPWRLWTIHPLPETLQ